MADNLTDKFDRIKAVDTEIAAALSVQQAAKKQVYWSAVAIKKLVASRRDITSALAKEFALSDEVVKIADSAWLNPDTDEVSY